MWLRRNRPGLSFAHSRKSQPRVAGLSGPTAVPDHGQASGGQPGDQAQGSPSVRHTLNINNLPLAPGQTKVIQHTLIVSKQPRPSTSRHQHPQNMPQFSHNSPRGARNQGGSHSAPGMGNTNFGTTNGGAINGHNSMAPGNGLRHPALSEHNGIANLRLPIINLPGNANGMHGLADGVGSHGNGFPSRHGHGLNSNGYAGATGMGSTHGLNGGGDLHANGHNSVSHGLGNGHNSNGIQSGGHGHSFNANTNGDGVGHSATGNSGLEIIVADLVAHSQHNPSPGAAKHNQVHANGAAHPTGIPTAVDIFPLPNELPINNADNAHQHVVAPNSVPQRLLQVQLPSGQSAFYSKSTVNAVNSGAANAHSLPAAGGSHGAAAAAGTNSATAPTRLLDVELLVTTERSYEDPHEVNGQQEIEA